MTDTLPDSLEELRKRTRAGETFKYLYFWGHTRRGRDVGKECLSQWFPCEFEVDDVRYASAEHFMMARKAALFDDTRAEQKIIKAKSPGEAKALGREVRGFKAATWDDARFDIVVEGNVAKFSQNPAIGQFLRATGNRVLVEASPRDNIWGIGLSATDREAEDPAEWQGLNLLGFALMVARRRLAE